MFYKVSLKSKNKMYKDMKKLLSGVVALVAILIWLFLYQKSSPSIAVEPIHTGTAEQVQNPITAVPATIPEQVQNPTTDVPATIPKQANTGVLPTPTEPTATEPAPKTRYKNGTYTQTVSYVSPGGTDKLKVTLIVSDDKVASATVSGTPSSPASTNYQAEFEKGFKQKVVGKSLDGLTLNAVNGASLTTGGFMDAVSQIKKQAA